MKKTIIIALCTLLILSSFVACGSNGGSSTGSSAAGTSTSPAATEQPAPSGEKVTIKVLNAEVGLGENAIPLFEELNPNIIVDIEYVPTDNYFAKVSSLTTANALPDVLWSQSSFFVAQVQNNMLTDLTEDFKSQNYEGDAVWIDTYIPELLTNSRSLLRGLGSEYDSKYYGIPYAMTSIAVVYDKNMFDEMGLSAPKNWEEFAQLNDTLVAAGKVPFSLTQPWNDWYPRFFWDQYCRDELTANPTAFEDGSMTFNSESVRKGLEAFKDMWDRGWLPESGLTATREDMQQLFVQGKIAQFLCSPAMLPYMYENVPDNVSLASYAFPGIAGLPSRSLGGSSVVFTIPVGTSHKDEALTLIKFLTSKTNFSQDYNKFLMSGLLTVGTDESVAQLRQGYNDAAANGFVPEIFVPINQSPELVGTYRSDLAPNYLMGVYSLDHVCNELQRIYEESYLATKK